jgi:protein-tyrosine phosphatase
LSAVEPEWFLVDPGSFVAGKYPGAKNDEAGAGRKLSAILTNGVTLFVDLTEEGELDPYAHLLDGRAGHVRHPIRDMSVTATDEMRAILDEIDGELGRGGIPYVHCWGGCGRTGTVVGAWWVRHGMPGDEAVERYYLLSRSIQWQTCPQTDRQRAMIRDWQPGS